MRNKLKFIIVICFFLKTSFALSESFTFKVKNIEIFDKGDLVNAYDGSAISNDANLEIISNKFVYTKSLDILNTFGEGVARINSEKLIIRFDNGIFDQKNLYINASGNVEILKTDGEYILKSDEIFYDQKKRIISSDKTTKISDNNGNIHYVDDFIYEIEKDLIKVNNLISKDTQQNTFKTSVAFINVKSKKIYGKDVKIDLNNLSAEEEGDYRLRGNSGKIDDNSALITKGVFTTCKKRDQCPPWQFSAKNIKHDKKKREIIYNDALLKIYDVPIAYFPKFFHPDPSVKRQSGFLIPSLSNSSNSGNYLNIPYFFAIAENKDATLNPRLYADEKILLQSEFRQKNLNSDHIADFSFFNEKNKSSKKHFFYNFAKKLQIDNFQTSKIDIKIQNTSNDSYLKSQKLKSELINDYNIMENSLGLDLYSNDLSINLSSTVYEDLNKNKSDRYEYVLPRVQISKNLNENLSLDSDTLFRFYDTNVKEKRNTNNLIFNSSPKINKFGFVNDYKFLIRNTNSENKNSSYKNKKHVYMSGIYQYNSSLPLVNENKIYQKILIPKLSLRAAPNHTVDARDSERKIDITNIYSLDRSTDNTSVEGGLSAAYGFDFSLINKLKTREIFNLKLANNTRLDKNDDLINTNQIGEKSSNVFSEITYNPTNNISTKYISSIKNNLKDISYENLISRFEFNNFITTFDYLNENNTSNKNSYISNNSNFSINEFNNFSFSTRKNKNKDLTEYYNFMYQYKNDCLAASIEYSKDFYEDKELKPEESIFFKLTIMPFAELKSPNIKQK